MSNIPSSVPVLRGEGGLAAYLHAIRAFPVLEASEEYMLAKSWRDHGHVPSAHRLVTSHLRLVARIALGYRGYGLPLADLISEGNIGMMQAVRRFDPERGFRLATYAMWWIRAAIQEYILRSWSLVKIGTTAAQKKLFFNLRRLKHEMRAIDDGELSPEQVTSIANKLAVSEQEVIVMNRRLSHGGDASINAPINYDENPGEWQDMIADNAESAEIMLGESQEFDMRHRLLKEAMTALNQREREILIARRLSDPAATLDDLSHKYGISRERVRQLETQAFNRLQKGIKSAARNMS